MMITLVMMIIMVIFIMIIRSDKNKHTYDDGQIMPKLYNHNLKLIVTMSHQHTIRSSYVLSKMPPERQVVDQGQMLAIMLK